MFFLFHQEITIYMLWKLRKKDLLLPAIGEVIKHIDIPNNKIIVHLIEGLR